MNVLGDDDSLAEEVVWQLDVERQIEPDGATADVGSAARNVRIVLEDVVEQRTTVSLAKNRRICGSVISTRSSGRSDDGKN